MRTAFRIFGIFILTIILCCLTTLVGEWVYSEARFQLWLNQDERRLDYSSYDTPEELRNALLTKLPPGSSEEQVQAFLIVNGNTYQKPGMGTKGRFGVVMQEHSHSNRGLFGLRVFLPGVWIIFFELDPTDHTLADISIELHPGP